MAPVVAVIKSVGSGGSPVWDTPSGLFGRRATGRQVLARPADAIGWLPISLPHRRLTGAGDTERLTCGRSVVQYHGGALRRSSERRTHPETATYTTKRLHTSCSTAIWITPVSTTH